MSIQSFINSITPSSDEIEQISISWWNIRSTIESKLDIFWWSKLTWSYSRRTKIKPIDDLDIIFKLKAWNTTFWESSESWRYYVTINSWFENSHPLRNFTNYNYSDGKYYISPIMITNKMVEKIKETYSTTPYIKRNWECVTVNLSSYELTIDCTPYIWVTDESYILIPAWWNNLYWKKTNPENDIEVTNKLNSSECYDWKYKWVIKLMKYRNEYVAPYKMRSYVLECAVYSAIWVNYFSLLNDDYRTILKWIVFYLIYNRNQMVKDIPWYEYLSFWFTDYQWAKYLEGLNKFFKILWIDDDALINYFTK